MKIRYLLLSVFVLFATIASAQTCAWTVSGGGALSTYSFAANPLYPTSSHFFQWDFGDGHSSTQANPTHTYNSTGPFVVCCTITDTIHNIICTHCDTLFTNNPMGCSFSSSHTPGNPFAYSFFVNPSQGAANVSWNFGDGATGTGFQVAHTYTTTGTFQVCAVITDTAGFSCTYCDTVVVSNQSTLCNYTYMVDQADSNTIHFAGSVGSMASIIRWDFGDGTSINGGTVNASHTFTAPGVYNVCLYEIDPLSGTILCSFCHPITIGSNSFNCTFTSVVDPLDSSTFTFTANVAQGAFIVWDYGDNTSDTGSATVSHTYSAPGTYNVCVTVQQLGATCTDCHHVTVGNSTTPCTFTYTSPPANPNVVVFAASPMQSGSNISWDFGDGHSGTGMQVTHQYTHQGVYNVCMEETDPLSGTILCTYCQTIVVSGGLIPCQANFIATSLGLNGYFIDMSNASANASYHWDFGDGNTSSTRFPQHLYSAPGTYTVCLTITDLNCTDHYCSTLLIDTAITNPAGCQAFYAIVQLAPYQVTVVNLSSGLNLSFLWDFGDGNTSTLPYPSHFYNSTGTYNLCLTVSDSSGCTSTYCDTLNVDTLGNIFRMAPGFSLNVVSPAQLTIGIEEVPADVMFTAYPNPFSRTITVETLNGKSDATNYRIYSADGRVVAEGALDLQTRVINAEQLSSGIYILEVVSGNTGSRRLIVKE